LWSLSYSYRGSAIAAECRLIQKDFDKQVQLGHFSYAPNCRRHMFDLHDLSRRVHRANVQLCMGPLSKIENHAARREGQPTLFREYLVEDGRQTNREASSVRRTPGQEPEQIRMLFPEPVSLPPRAPSHEPFVDGAPLVRNQQVQSSTGVPSERTGFVSLQISRRSTRRTRSSRTSIWRRRRRLRSSFTRTA
jgi:hypothetical protein